MFRGRTIFASILIILLPVIVAFHAGAPQLRLEGTACRLAACSARRPARVAVQAISRTVSRAGEDVKEVGIRLPFDLEDQRMEQERLTTLVDEEEVDVVPSLESLEETDPDLAEAVNLKWEQVMLEMTKSPGKVLDAEELRKIEDEILTSVTERGRLAFEAVQRENDKDADELEAKIRLVSNALCPTKPCLSVLSSVLISPSSCCALH